MRSSAGTTGARQARLRVDVGKPALTKSRVDSGEFSHTTPKTDVGEPAQPEDLRGRRKPQLEGSATDEAGPICAMLEVEGGGPRRAEDRDGREEPEVVLSGTGMVNPQRPKPVTDKMGSRHAELWRDSGEAQDARSKADNGSSQ